MCDYETMESVNDDLFSNLSELVEKPFFRYFQVSTRALHNHISSNPCIRSICIVNVRSGMTGAHVVMRDVL